MSQSIEPKKLKTSLFVAIGIGVVTTVGGNILIANRNAYGSTMRAWGLTILLLAAVVFLAYSVVRRNLEQAAQRQKARRQQPAQKYSMEHNRMASVRQMYDVRASRLIAAARFVGWLVLIGGVVLGISSFLLNLFAIVRSMGGFGRMWVGAIFPSMLAIFFQNLMTVAMAVGNGVLLLCAAEILERMAADKATAELITATPLPLRTESQPLSE
ncbi:MAG: hypothetical protein R3C28_18870 [Pirellulaceae bacterium]